ncbi:MAG: hypothetical protein QNJ40_07205 [Xanthomonadales bacterium]|nr:hypothetical protein [Xanthomonadales bacterium]
MNKYRPTFLMRTVSLGVSVAVVVAFYVLTENTLGVTAAIFVFISLWVFGIEIGLIAMVLEKVFSSRLLPTNGRASNLWFINVEAQKRLESERMKQKVSKNPTL